MKSIGLISHTYLSLSVLSGNSADSLSEDSDVEQSKEKPEAVFPATTIVMKKTTGNSKSPRAKKMNSGSLLSAGRKKGSGQPKPGESDCVTVIECDNIYLYSSVPGNEDTTDNCDIICVYMRKA